MLLAIFFSTTGTVLYCISKHFRQTLPKYGGYTSAEQRASFCTFFLTYYPAVDEEKTNRRSQIQIYGSEYNTDIYRWWNVQRVTFIYP
jgi:hypothetical protein